MSRTIKARKIKGIVIGRMSGIVVRLKRREMGVPRARIVCLKCWIGPITSSSVERRDERVSSSSSVRRPSDVAGKWIGVRL